MNAFSRFLEESDLGFRKATYDEEHDGFEVSAIYQQEISVYSNTQRIQDPETTLWLDELSKVHNSEEQDSCALNIV